MPKIKIALFLISFLTMLSIRLFADVSDEWSKRKITDEELVDILNPVNEEIKSIKSAYAEGDEEAALRMMASYYKEKMSRSFFFDWKNFEERFEFYKNVYPSKIEDHKRRKEIHLDLFPADTEWKLPLIGLKGQKITPYILRHLARQHKMIDVAFSYYLQDKNKELLSYFTDQVNSLYDSYIDDDYEKKGNSVFEYYRAGYRVYNWLLIHNLFLASEDYSYRDQIDLIKTFLYHAADLYQKTEDFNNGNHHTKGLMALALVSILFDEFQPAQKWFDHSIKFLTRHLEEEINSDGFQFERSVHYHIGDIDNFFYVYYLASINNKQLPEKYINRFRSMFDALVKIAFPNKSLPVLQDDTDEPWAEFNKIGGVMAMGTILFEDPIYKYFADDLVSGEKYWFFRSDDLNALDIIDEEKPQLSSIALDQTGYYVMRNGWQINDEVMIINAGLSDKKPDHQHADMLGLVSYANNNFILPNYQVRYYLDDFKFFKGSFVKNVALVDSLPQAVDWKGNTGGSGFGKWRDLPTPRVLTWAAGKDFDLFIGTHNGYDEQEVDYRRKVIFFKDGFWIIKDSFTSNNLHSYQQVWQGNFDEENNNHIRTTFANGAGLDIIQLIDNDYTYNKASGRGKGRSVVNVKNKSGFEFVTLVYPFAHFDERIDERFDLSTITGNWQFTSDDKDISFFDHNYKLFLNAEKIETEDGVIIFDKKNDLIIEQNEIAKIYLLEPSDIEAILLKNGVEKKITIKAVGNEFIYNRIEDL